MPCFHPLHGFYADKINPETGKRPVYFNPKKGVRLDWPVTLPCGRCLGCRLERSRQWAVRCVHEASQHEENAFITLTFRPACQLHRVDRKGIVRLPKCKLVDPTISLHKFHFQDFMKRLRFRFPSKTIKYFHAGEYGERFGRPHHHACLFGIDFPDKELWDIRNGNRLYTSKILDEVWGHGSCIIGDVTFESAAYIARYIMKKIKGNSQAALELAAAHYCGRTPEYATMSRRPGIGKNWYDEYKGDVFPSDEVVLRGKQMRPPRFYDKQLEKEDPKLYEKIKLDRKAEAVHNASDNTKRRLLTKEQCKIAQFQQLKRGLENEV